MHNTGFELMDMLLCCKFAEGDSRILQMKLARDRLKQVKKDGAIGTLSKAFGSDGKEALTALNLARKVRMREEQSDEMRRRVYWILSHEPARSEATMLHE